MVVYKTSNNMTLKKSITNGYPFSHCLKLIRTNSV